MKGPDDLLARTDKARLDLAMIHEPLCWAAGIPLPVVKKIDRECALFR